MAIYELTSTSGAAGSFTTTNGETVNYTTSGAGGAQPTGFGNIDGTNIWLGDYATGAETVYVTFTQPGTAMPVSVTGLEFKINGTDVGEIMTFNINGTVVDLNTLIADGSVTLIQGGSNTDINASGQLVGVGSSMNGSDTYKFNIPIETLSVAHNGSGNGSLVEMYVDTGLVTICFTRDTMIDTDLGEVAVQDLATGMMVRTRDHGFQPIRWVGMTPAKDRAVRIKAGALGNTRDLVVSPRHRMVLDGWQLKMLFSHDHALVTAQELVNDSTIVMDAMADVEYYHVMFDAHEVIFAEGAATESFHPDQPSMGSMADAARAEILALFPELADVTTTRAQAAPTLDPVQANYVARNLDAFVG
jgi:Hint domain